MSQNMIASPSFLRWPPALLVGRIKDLQTNGEVYVWAGYREDCIIWVVHSVYGGSSWVPWSGAVNNFHTLAKEVLVWRYFLKADMRRGRMSVFLGFGKRKVLPFESFFSVLFVVFCSLVSLFPLLWFLWQTDVLHVANKHAKDWPYSYVHRSLSYFFPESDTF